MGSYPWASGRSEAETEFLQHIEGRSSKLDSHPLFDAWTFYPQLVLTLTISDPDHNVILRTLRVDFDGSKLQGGNDRSHQIDPDLDRSDPDFFEVTALEETRTLAEKAFVWFCDQAVRPIDRLEWDGPDHRWLLWVLVDTRRALVQQYRNPPARPADRTVRLESLAVG